MAEVGTYYITIMPEMSNFTSEVNSALKGTGKTSGKGYSNSFVDIVKGSALGSALGSLASKAGGSIASGFSTGISRLDTIKNYPKVMQSLGYSTEDADRSIKTIMGHLDGLPTATQDMVTLTQAISDSTGDLDLATAAALGFNDMMLANGASSAEVANAQAVLNRVLGKGSATAAQWSSLTSVMPAQLGMVARSMLGTEASTEDLHTALEDGTVSWNDFLQAIADIDKNGYIDESGKKIASFEEQARANSHGIGTAIDNIRNRIGAGWAEILDKVGQEEISTTIDKMSYGVKGGMIRVADAVGYLKEKIGNTKIGENLKKIFDAAAKGISDIDTDALKQFADSMIDLIDKALQWLVDHGEALATALTAIATAIGVIAGYTMATTVISGVSSALEVLSMVTIGGGIAATLGEVGAGFMLLAETGGPLAGLFAGLGGVLTWIAANPMVLVVAAIAAVVAGLVYFFTQTETGKAIWESFCNGLKELWEGLKTDWKNLCDVFSREWESFQAFIDGIPEWWQGVMDYWSSAMDEQKRNFALAWDKIKSDFSDAWEAIKKKASDIWNGICTTVTTTVNNIKTTLANIWENIKSTVNEKWTAIKTFISNTIENIRTSVSNKVSEIKTNVSTIVDSIRAAISEKLTSAKEKALSIFDGIKDGIKEKIDWAYNKIKGIVDDIKGLFNFEWSLPAPKLPHITWGWDDVGGIVSVPSFGIDWYGKGGVFDSANVIGIGEKGREAALPLNRNTYGEIARGIVREGGGGVTVTGNTFIVREEADIDRIADALDRKIYRERLAMLA